MSEPITKEALDAFTDATKQSAEELGKIVISLAGLGTQMEKIVDKIFNGMTQEIVDGVTSNYTATHKETIQSLERLETATKDCKGSISNCLEDKIKNSSMAKDIEHTKWFVGIIGLCIIILTVIFKLWDIRTLQSEETRVVKQIVSQYDLIKKDHVQSMSKVQE